MGLLFRADLGLTVGGVVLVLYSCRWNTHTLLGAQPIDGQGQAQCVLPSLTHDRRQDHPGPKAVESHRPRTPSSVILAE